MFGLIDGSAVGPQAASIHSTMMSRKRKKVDKAVAHVTRVISAPLHLNRTTSVHATASGRSTQTTSFLASTFVQDQQHPTVLDPHAHQGSSEVASGDDIFDDYAPSGCDEEPPDDHDVNDSEDTPLSEWVKYHRASYLDEIIRHEGRAGVQNCTKGCRREGLFKCKDCFGCRVWCRLCFLEQHAQAPLHRALVSRSLRH